MRRTVEASLFQSLRATGETLNLYLTSEAGGKRVNIPRTSLAIFNAINIAFPNELAGRKKEALQVISSVAPILISANEAVDIGVSARLQLHDMEQNLTEEKRKGLKQLENGTFDSLDRSIAGFKDTYGPRSRESQVVDAFVRDFMMLSEERRKFSVEEYREYVELDSVIYVLGCLALAAPPVSELCGFDIKEKCANAEEVRRKYSVFVIGRDKSKGNRIIIMPRGNKTAVLAMAQIMSLQGAEMVLKVKDDKKGRKIDKLLGIPSLYDYAERKAGDEQSPHGILDQMRNEYFFLAETGGLPNLTVRSAEFLSHLTSVGKAKVAGLRVSSNVTENTSIASNSTTTLRHQLNAAGVLENLFSRV